MANQQSIKAGDAVLFEGELYSVLSRTDNDVTLKNVNAKVDALIEECEYIAPDTLSSRVRAKKWRIGDFVINNTLGLHGEVIGFSAGSVEAEVRPTVEVEVSLADWSVRTYWWLEEELSTHVSSYRTKQSFIGTSPITSAHSTKPKKTKKTAKPIGISRAGLIKSEVSKLEKEQRVRPLKTGAQTKPSGPKEEKKDDDIFGPTKPIQKRKSDW